MKIDNRCRLDGRFVSAFDCSICNVKLSYDTCYGIELEESEQDE